MARATSGHDATLAPTSTERAPLEPLEPLRRGALSSHAMGTACPRCRSEALEARGASASRCTSCRLVFSNQAGLLAGAHPHRGAELAPRAAEPIAAPAGLQVTVRDSVATDSYRGGGRIAAPDLEIQLGWRETSAIGLWDLGRVLGVLALFAVLALFTKSKTGVSTREVAAIPAAFFVVLCYVTLAIAVNRTTIALRDGRLRVRSGPLPWGGRRDLDAESIQQIYCEQRTTDRGSAGVLVMALLRDGDSVKIGPSLGSTEHALFIEDTLERLLRIEDRPVEGEAKYRKP